MRARYLFHKICLVGCVGFAAFLLLANLVAIIGSKPVTLDFNYYHEAYIEAGLLAMFVTGGFIGIVSMKRNPWRKN
jgi:hypothetical protein